MSVVIQFASLKSYIDPFTIHITKLRVKTKNVRNQCQIGKIDRFESDPGVALHGR